jgi:hypothetical protein
MPDKKASMNRPWRPTAENMRLKPAPTEPVACPHCEQTFASIAEAVEHALQHRKGNST